MLNSNCWQKEVYNKMKKLKIVLLIIFLIVIILLLILLSKKGTNKGTLPYLLDEDCKIIESDISKGMTIVDKYENEWVWISVPKTEVFKKAKDDKDYENIWLAHYTTKTSYENYDIWQLSNIGKIGGINGDVDIDVMQKSFLENDEG